MRSEQFRSRLLAAVPDAATPSVDSGDDLAPFAVVSEMFVPAFLTAVDRLHDGDPAAAEQVTVLAQLLEDGIVDGDGYLLDALVMRVVERHLSRRPDLYAAAEQFLGPATIDACGRFVRLIEDSRRQLAAATARRNGTVES